jgi:hypothetical protein
MAQTFKAKTLVSNSGRFSYEVIAPNLIYTTGNQDIGGDKNFYTRPTVNGTGVLLIGEASNLILPNTIVYITGDQTISGVKTFTNSGLFLDGIKVGNDSIYITQNRIEGGYSSSLNSIDGLLGIQYSGYYDSDPTWFNTASVKPIINELFLNHPTSDMLGPYIKIGDQNNQGTYYFQGTEGNAGWAIYYYPAFPTSESYWYLQSSIGPIHSKSNDLITWTMTPEAIEEYGDEGAPTTTITQTQNFENSTNFGAARALSNDTSWQWVGYFRPQNTSNHSFTMYADENAYFWIGDKALNGYTAGNADMYSDGLLGSSVTDLALISGVNYPVRLQWGHPGNPTTLGLSLSYYDEINGSNNFSGLFFHGLVPVTSGFYIDAISGDAVFAGNIQSNTATFNNRPTVNNIPVLLSSDISNSPDIIVYATGDQTISGIKTFASAIQFGVDTTRTTLSGTATTNRTIYLPDANGTLVLDSNLSNVVYSTGNQIISGIKTFTNNLEVQGTGIFEALDLSNISQFDFSGTNINLVNGNVNISGGTLYISGNAVLTGLNLDAYATSANLFTTGSTLNNKINSLSGYVTGITGTFGTLANNLYSTGSILNNKINSLSGYVNSQDSLFSGQIALTGSILDNKINNLSGWSASAINLFATGSTLNNKINSLSGLFAEYTGSLDSTFATDTQLFTTGSILDNKINSLSGYISGISIGGSLPNSIVYITGNQNISGLKNFTTIPTVNGTGVLLVGAAIPSTIASGVGGSVFITYVTPSGGVGNVGDYVYENIADGVGNTALISCSTTVQTVEVDIYALQGRTRFKPKLYIAGQEIPSSLVVRQNDRPVFLVDNFGVNLNNATSLRVEHEDGAYDTISITQDAPPQVLSAYFYGTYPGSQTELKYNDTFNFTVNSDVAIVAIQIYDFGAARSDTHNFTAATSKNITITIADRGNTTQNLGVKLRVQKANGSWSSDYLTSNYGSTDGIHTVKLNNTYPSVSVTTINYPGSQQALKDSESATVSNTVLNYDAISYTSPNSDLTITNSSSYETSKTVTRSAGNYNISTPNFRITATRNANNAVTTNSSTVVKIAHTAPTLTVSVPAARLRTGGNDGTTAQSYTVTITATQQLLSAPTLSVPAGGGTLGSFGGSTTTWTATLSNINDNLIKQTYTWGAISATNLAGKVVTTITTGPTYVIGGFLSRTVSLAAFANEVNINTSVLDYSKMTLSWVIKSLPNRRAVGTTATPDPNSWSINSLSVNPTIVRILDTAATQSSSAATNVTVEETV